MKDRLVGKGYKNEIIEIDTLNDVNEGDAVYVTYSTILEKKIKENFLSLTKSIEVKMFFEAKIGQKMKLKVADEISEVEVESDYIVEKALNSPTSIERVKEQLLKTGATNYVVNKIYFNLDDNIMLPIKYLNDLRRSIFEKLDKKRDNIYHRTLDDITANYDITFEESSQKMTTLSVKVHNLAQLEAAISAGIKKVYFEDLNNINEISAKYSKVNIIPVLPRVDFKNQFIDIDNEDILVNDLGYLNIYKNASIDSYFNISNTSAIRALRIFNTQTIFLSNELNKNQVAIIAKNKGNNKIGMIVYGRLDMMILKYCPISKGYGINKFHCQKCTAKQHFLQDKLHYKFPLINDDFCNVRLINSRRLHLINDVSYLKHLGIDELRLDFTIENKSEVVNIVTEYIKAFNDEIYNGSLLATTYGHYKASDV